MKTSEERRREIASIGGKSVKPEQRSYSRDRKLASESGRKGGKNLPAHKRYFARNRDAAREAGRKGGLAVPPERRHTFANDPAKAKEAGRRGGLARHAALRALSSSEKIEEASPSDAKATQSAR